MPHLSGNSISIFRRTILLSGGRGFWFNPKSIQCHTLRVKSFTSLMVDLRQSKCFVKTPKWYEERRRSSVKENKWLGHKIVCNPTFNLLCGILHIFRMSKYMIHMFKETFSKPNLIYYYITPCKNNWHHKIEKVQFLLSFLWHDFTDTYSFVHLLGLYRDCKFRYKRIGKKIKTSF